MARTYNCWMLNCWCITWPVGFKRLRGEAALAKWDFHSYFKEGGHINARSYKILGGTTKIFKIQDFFIRRRVFLDCLILKMKALSSFESSVIVYLSTGCKITEGLTVQQHDAKTPNISFALVVTSISELWWVRMLQNSVRTILQVLRLFRSNNFSGYMISKLILVKNNY